MPGPRNAKKRRQVEAKKPKRTKSQQVAQPVSTYTSETSCAIDGSIARNEDSTSLPYDTCSSMLRTPFIQNPGSGPRVRDTRAFLVSTFAAPPSFDDPLCAEFAQEEVLEMLCAILPEETALILWYNKSRGNARICPACQRLYRLGDTLPDHLDPSEAKGSSTLDQQPSPYLLREQELSGLCSPVCFILAAYNYPGAIRSTWGRVAEELDDETWRLLDAPGAQQNDIGLGMLVKMTRCHDLGLGQLLFPDVEMDSDETYNEGELDDVDKKTRDTVITIDMIQTNDMTSS
ncbi:hypothetical protein CERSUDRAFT_97088 [Gelatoporia subvermispora B]|uniref:Uncharacterized protein n=1 Tax=Ceriporiopsis subvermispora (strain B) TaxID=914234 RepID=M2R8V5_CERS8|nr:hypothetical protein CERSUDRAFT_97088 [Gelatoporia subvermispora B]